MSKKKKASSSVSEENDVDQSRMPVSELHGSITITVLAKPGAKQTAITEITSDGVLAIRKSDVRLDKGSKSRLKTLSISSDAGLPVATILERLHSEIEKRS
ncbi:UPF0235 protein C15orf40 homolog isoform X2 [Corticium candelabrum]|uniref:UPF0235 protein C15orf40 homolog isoform X2 n=1 Tax=Corticium candelabrum TaxID=121492 RepID=UPI002E25D403|nr:UPF0235 protein C15orf40 homolog isoform X2 [Corticium candelabrum]